MEYFARVTWDLSEVETDGEKERQFVVERIIDVIPAESTREWFRPVTAGPAGANPCPNCFRFMTCRREMLSGFLAENCISTMHLSEQDAATFAFAVRRQRDG